MDLPTTPERASPSFEARYYVEGLRFEEVCYTSNLQMPVHTHAETFVDLCLEGTIQEFWGKQTFVRGPATLNFVPAGALHGNHFPEQSLSFQIVINTAWLERIEQGTPLVQTRTHFPEGPATWLAARLYREFQYRDSVSPLVLEGLLLQLLAEMSRHADVVEDRNDPQWLRQAKDFLHVHFMESVAIDTIAKSVGVHPAHLMRSFQQRYHSTIGEYLRKLRVEYACHLLCTSNTSPAQIAFAVGFADQSHFYRTFKALMGMTPTQYRKLAGCTTQILGNAMEEQEMLL